jgi:hypothetical protein
MVNLRQTDLEHSPTAIHIDQCYQLYQNQEEHHKIKTFKEEYVEFLKLYNVDFKMNIF